MKHFLTTFFVTFIALNIINAQSTKDLYMPKEIKKAYENGTRSYDGKPGKNYFQNRTDYKIKAEFNPKTRILTGEELIDFQNNSTENLSRLYVQLHQDMLKKGSIRDFDLGSVDIHDGVEIKSLKVNGKVIDVSSNKVRRNATIMMVALDDNILAGSKNIIEIKWSLIIPGTVPVRMGTYDSTNFMIAYWYPKISVYDDISGWNTIPYAGKLEFYSDYGDFDVEITVPAEYTVLSSGLLQNSKEIFTDKYLKLINKAAVSDKIIQVIAKGDRKKGNITQKATNHTWKFKAEFMPDFAFAISNKYLWDASSVKVGNKRVLVHAIYPENSKDFHEVAEFSRRSIDYLSTKTPAIPFPYPQFVAFNGSRSGGGMEFPGMMNNSDSQDRNGTINVTAHEIGHSYYPFYVGTNEQKYAWVDEGLISFFPRKVIAELTHDKNYKLFTEIPNRYNYMAGSSSEIPLIVSSENTGEAWYYQFYVRSAAAFYTLHELIGSDKFNVGLQEYTKRWKGKHPTPYDLFFTFNEVIGEDLAWFWKPWFFEMGYADLALGKVTEKSKTTEIVVEKRGLFPVQINLKVIYKDGTEKEFKKPASIWKDGLKAYSFEVPKGDFQEIVLDNTFTPDAFGKNNIWTAPHSIDKKIMQSYVGKYGPRNIFIENNKLYYQRDGGIKMEMITLNDQYFRFSEIDYFRLRIIKEKGKVIALEGNYSDGHNDRNDKDE